MPPRPPVPAASRRRAGRRGSVLLAAMLFAAGIAVVLGSYLTLSRTSLKVAHRTFFAHDAANLAEAGLEEALSCFNLMAAGTAPATAWTGWTVAGADAMRTLAPINRSQSAIGLIKVYVSGYDGSVAAPYVVAQATVTPFDGGAPVSKTVHLVLRRNTGTVSPGLVALTRMQLLGSVFVDSFDSNPTGSPTGPWLPYSSGVARSNATVAVLSGSLTMTTSGQIMGNLCLGPGVTAPAASKVTGTITPDYSATFPFPAYPTAASVSRSYDLGTSIPATLPRSGDLPAADGRYYYFVRNTTVRNFSVTANRHVTIVGTSSVGMTTGITLPTTSTLHVYMTGTLVMGTNATHNLNGWAGALRIYTTTSGTCTLGNNARLVACFHAPNAELRLTGTGGSSMIMGYYVANRIYASGNHDIHVDESLHPPASTASYEVTRWLDFHSAADRALVAGLTGGYLR